MLPEPRRIIPASAAHAACIVPVRLISIGPRQASPVMRTAGPSRVIPAFATRASSGPRASSTSRTIAGADAGSRASARWTCARRPAAATRSATRSAPARSSAKVSPMS